MGSAALITHVLVSHTLTSLSAEPVTNMPVSTGYHVTHVTCKHAQHLQLIPDCPQIQAETRAEHVCKQATRLWLVV